MENQTTMRKVDKLIIHCSDTYAEMDIDGATIRGWHVDERGWSDIGYHFVIRRDGTVELGRDLDKDGDVYEEIGAHVKGWNKNSIGICMVGGRGDDDKPESNFTDDQWRSLETVLKIIRADYPGAIIYGHNEFADKACPSFDVQKWLKTVRV